MLLLLLCKFYTALLLDPICIIIFCLEAFWNFVLMKFYFSLGLMIAYKLLRVVFQTSDVWETENLSRSYVLLCIFFSALHGLFPCFFKSLEEEKEKKKRCQELAVLIMCLFWKGRNSWCQGNCLQTCDLIFTCWYAHCVLVTKYGIIWIAVIAVRITVINKWLAEFLWETELSVTCKDKLSM